MLTIECMLKVSRRHTLIKSSPTFLHSFTCKTQNYLLKMCRAYKIRIVRVNGVRTGSVKYVQFPVASAILFKSPLLWSFISFIWATVFTIHSDYDNFILAQTHVHTRKIERTLTHTHIHPKKRINIQRKCVK